MTHTKKTNSTCGTGGFGGSAFGTKQERCVSLGQYIIANKTTVRAAAKTFGISKSTVHTVVT